MGQLSGNILTRKQKIEAMSPKGPQTYQLGDKMVTKEEFDKSNREFKQKLANRGTPDLTPGVPPFANKDLKAKLNAEDVPATPGHTAEEFQAQQQKALETANTPLPQGATIPKTAEVIPGKGIGNSEMGVGLTGEDQAARIFNKIQRGGVLTREEQALTKTLNVSGFDIQQIQSGRDNYNSLSRIVEGLPILGKLHARGHGGVGISLSVADFVGKSPGTKVEELTRSLEANSNDIVTDLENVQKFPLQARFWKSEAEQHKQVVLQLESRIKLLSIVSPEVQGDPDISDGITRRIQNAKQKSPELDW